jgi:hypothetical protein
MTRDTQINWAELRTATGTAEAIPDALEALCSADKKTREVAYWKIDNHAVVQGDLYDAAPFAVKGLLDCLRSTPVSKEEIYSLLVEFANGYAPETQLIAVESTEYPLKIATTRELANGMDLYWRDLRDAAPSTRKRVSELLLALAEDIEVEPAKLLAALENETDEEVRELLGEVLQEARAQSSTLSPAKVLRRDPQRARRT